MSTPEVHDPAATGVRDAATAGAPGITEAMADATVVQVHAGAASPDVTVPPTDAPAPTAAPTPSASATSLAPAVPAGAAADAAVPAAAADAQTDDPSRMTGNSVTLYDVARIAGVSTATVSRVVHSLDRVRDSTRARVLEVINQLGYVPDGAAQSLSRRQESVIGLVGVERLGQDQYDIES